MLRILVVEDSPPLRVRLAELIQEAFQGSHIGQAGDGQHALNLVRAARWDVVVLDVSMPGESGLLVLTQLLALTAGLLVVMCSAHSHPAVVKDSFRRGALGFVDKQDVPAAFVPAIKSALVGLPYRSPRAVEPAPAAQRPWPPAPSPEEHSAPLRHELAELARPAKQVMRRSVAARGMLQARRLARKRPPPPQLKPN